MLSMHNLQNFLFVVPCAGYGSRMNSHVPKQYLHYEDKPIIYYTLKVLSFFKFPIVLVVSPDDSYIQNYKHLFSEYVDIQYIGGDTRANSVLHGLNYLSKKYNNNPWVLVHDGARPLIKIEDIQKLINECTKANQEQGGLIVSKVVDTIKQNKSNTVVTIDRSNMYLAQTPQMFKLDILFNALQVYDNVSDEASAIEKMGISPLLVEGSRLNIKITMPEDLEWLKFLPII
ncbi:MAG: 4-diphosphocytidyl-2C-methyl-D-erythritol synthase [Pseudomonadota bacterium]|jgi:2-C-methyl-D-erythritol 4-phosphate cytidylyltransferase